MSNFLRNVATRSLGAVETVLPRIPSLYEPYRTNDGPFVAREQSSSAEADLERPGASATDSVLGKAPARPGAVILPSLAQEPFHSRADAPVQPQQPQMDRLATTSQDANRRRLPAQPARMPAASIPAANNGSEHAAPREANSATIESESVSAPAPRVAKPIINRPFKRDPMDVQAPSSSMDSAKVEPAPRLNRAVDAGGPAPVSQLNDHGPKRQTISAHGSDHPLPASPPESSAAEVTTTQMRHAKPLASADTGNGPAAHSALVRPPSQWNLPSARPSAEPEVRPSTEGRMAAASLSSPRHDNRPSPPDIQITIGTVEVRAVLPEKPATSARSKRPTSGLSLDDYLKRSHRGTQ